MNQPKKVWMCWASMLLLETSIWAAPVGTAITYQGTLEDGGGPVTNTSPGCNFEFTLWDDPAAGSQIGGTESISGVSVDRGVFTVDLDFTAGAFNGEARWLEISVCCPSPSCTLEALSPRVELTPAPHALALPGLYTQQTSVSPNVIGGFSGNGVTSGANGATIGGGGEDSLENRVTDIFGTVGGGANNQAGDGAGTTADAPYATVGGGGSNTASGSVSTVGGGSSNNASGEFSTVVGGLFNDATGGNSTVGGGSGNTASGGVSTVGGGDTNTAGGAYSTIPGGDSNSAGGDYSFAAGRQAKVRDGDSGSSYYSGDANGDEGTFVWADSTAADFVSTGPDQFLIRASGGVGIDNNSPNVALDVIGSIEYTGTITDVSDRRLKENIVPVPDGLKKTAQLRGVYFNMKDTPDVRDVGLIAQDVQKVLPEAVRVVDPENGYLGVSYPSLIPLLVEAIKQLRAEKDGQIASQQREIDVLRTRIETLERAASSSSAARAGLPFLLVALIGLTALRRLLAPSATRQAGRSGKGGA